MELSRNSGLRYVNMRGRKVSELEQLQLRLHEKGRMHLKCFGSRIKYMFSRTFTCQKILHFTVLGTSSTLQVDVILSWLCQEGMLGSRKFSETDSGLHMEECHMLVLTCFLVFHPASNVAGICWASLQCILEPTPSRSHVVANTIADAGEVWQFTKTFEN